MPSPKTMRDVVKALRKDGIRVRRPHDIKMGDEPEQCQKCQKCGREAARPLLYWWCCGIYDPPHWVAICADRPACRRRQAFAEAERVRAVLDEVVI